LINEVVEATELLSLEGRKHLSLICLFCTILG